MTALEQWYRDKIHLMKEGRKDKKKDRQMIRTGHKDIVGQIERQLKTENEQKLLNLTKMYRAEQENIQNDL